MAQEAFQLGQRVSLEFVTASDPISTQGVVARLEESGAGIAYRNFLAREQRDLLAKFLHQLEH